MDVHQTDSGYAVQGQVILSMPGDLCLRCFNFLRQSLLDREAQEYGNAGGRPQVIWPNGVLASTAVGLFTELMLPWHPGSRGRSGLCTTMMEIAIQSLSARGSQRWNTPFLPDTSETLHDIGDPFWRTRL